MKECHPDKFPDNEVLKLEAEEKSKGIIEAYHFLVSIAQETKDSNFKNKNTDKLRYFSIKALKTLFISASSFQNSPTFLFSGVQYWCAILPTF